MKRTYHGSCHCGAVRFACTVDLAAMTSKCNCSVCAKSRFWKAIATRDAFELLEGKEFLTEYTFGRNVIRHYFCRRCGVKAFGRGEAKELGGEFHAVNLACLDDASDEELAGAHVKYEDGRHDHWEREPAETRHL